MSGDGRNGRAGVLSQAAATWLRTTGDEITVYSDHVITKRGDEKSFSTHMIRIRRDEDKVYSGHGDLERRRR